jgi:uncharacterized iron-regulated membrane protein
MSGLEKKELTIWQLWRDHPERLWMRNVTFQIHFLVGSIVALYVFLMSVSGSLLVFHPDYADTFPVQGLVDFHTNLLAGPAGRIVNGIGAFSLLLLCLTGAVIWWPGIKHWRRSLTVAWGASFPRLNWDLHSALGFWFFGFVVMWGLSAVYFVFPLQLEDLLLLDPAGSFLVWLSELHFGRFGWVIQGVWLIVGLVPAVLAFTGLFICCRRVIYGKPSNPKNATD